MPRLCEQTTKTGVRCTMPAMNDRDSCFTHCQDPDVMERRRAALRLAGQRSIASQWPKRNGPDSARTLRQLSTLDFVRVVDLVSREIQHRVETGELPAMGQLEMGQPGG